jgi:hypothetical protein
MTNRVIEGLRDGWDSVVDRFDEFRPDIANIESSLAEIRSDAVELVRFVGGALSNGASCKRAEPERDTQTSGPVAVVTPTAVVQNVGRGRFVEHEPTHLDVVPMVGDNVRVQYRDGRATVTSLDRGGDPEIGVKR